MRTVRAFVIKTSIFRILIVLAGLMLGLYLLSSSADPIVRFNSSGIIARDRSEYRQQIHNILARSIFNRSKLLFDYQGVERTIKEQFPEIESVQVSFDLVGRRPVVKILTLRPSFIFRTNGLSWVLDQRGVAIGLQSELKPGFTTSLRAVNDEVGTNAAIGTQLMSLKQTKFLATVISLLEKQLVVVTEVTVPSSPKELDLKVAEDGWIYKLNIEEKPTQQAGTLLAARSTLKQNNNTPSEYVDLRISEKVFWK